MPKVLRKLQIESVGFVDKGAGKGVRIMLAKRLQKSNMEMGMDPKIQEILAALPPDVQAALTDYIASLQKAAPAPAQDKAPAVDLNPADDLPAPAKKRLEEKDEEIRKEREERATLAKRVKELEDANKLREFVAKADAMKYVPGLSVDEMGLVLKSASESLPGKVYAQLEKSLKAASEAIAKGNLLKEFGSDAPAADGPKGQIEAIAKQLQEKDPNLSHSQAILQAAEKNPGLYAQYRAETQKGAA